MRAVTLVGTDGTRVDLTSGPFHLGANPALWGMPPVATDTKTMPGVAGTPYGGSRFLERPLPCPVWVLGESALHLDESMAQLARLVNPMDGPCWLVVARPDGTAREIAVRYSSGFEAIPVRDAARSRAMVPMVFVAHAPFWRSTAEYEFDFEQAAFDVNAEPTPWDGPQSWDSPIPWDGAAAEGVAILPIQVNGDVESWPRFEITGPGSAVEAVNLRTGKLWRYDGDLLAGQKLVIETEPGRRSVRLDDVPALKALTTDSTLWGLKRGLNHVAVRILDYEPGQSVFRFSTRDLWLTS